MEPSRSSRYSPVLNYAVQQLGYQDYEEYLSSPHWRSYLSANKTKSCWCCSSQSPLAQHHITYKRLGCELPEDTVTLCFDCHTKTHQLCKDKKANLSYAHMMLRGDKSVENRVPTVRRKKLTKKKLRRFMKKNRGPKQKHKVAKSSKWMSLSELAEWRYESLSFVVEWLSKVDFVKTCNLKEIVPTEKAFEIHIVHSFDGQYLWNRRAYKSIYNKFKTSGKLPNHFKTSKRRRKVVSSKVSSNECELTIELTQEMVHEAMSVRGGWTMQQLALIGIPELTRGWKTTMVGRVVGYDNAVEFVRIRHELKATGQDLPKHK